MLHTSVKEVADRVRRTGLLILSLEKRKKITLAGLFFNEAGTEVWLRRGRGILVKNGRIRTGVLKPSRSATAGSRVY
jgi:hypothetical protein